MHWAGLVTLALLSAAVREAPPLHQVVHGPITFVAECRRHGETYVGRAFVGYVPTAGRLGPSALTRIVRQASRTGDVHIAARIATMLSVCVRPAGVATMIETAHHCGGLRVLQEGGFDRRTAWRGRYEDDATLRSEFIALCDSAR